MIAAGGDVNQADQNGETPLYIATYDFIYDGGTLDNVFSPANAIVSFSKMLKENGRILHSNMGSAWPGAYCSFSCEWFYSFYSNNNFKNVLNASVRWGRSSLKCISDIKRAFIH